MAPFLGLLFIFRIFSDDPYFNIIFLCTMVNKLFFSPQNSKYILTEPQMAKTFLKSLQRQQRNQTFKFSCNPAVYTDHTGRFNMKYAGKRQRIGTQLYPSSTTDLTITKTLSTFSDYRFFYRLLCILRNNGITKTGG